MLGLLCYPALAGTPDLFPEERAHAWRALLVSWPAALVAAINAVVILCGRRVAGWWQFAALGAFAACIAVNTLIG